MSKEHPTSRKLDSFSITMNDLLHACFSDSENYYFKDTQAVDFFLYIIKYTDTSPFSSSNGVILNKSFLIQSLAAKESHSDNPSVSVLFDFLREYLLNPKQNITRQSSYSDKSGRTFIQKSLSDLKDYCLNNFSENLLNENDITTPDSLIDLITICLLAGRHGLPSYKSPLSNLYRPTINSKLLSVLNKRPSRFTIIYGSLHERTCNYMDKYVLNQLHGISYKSSYSSYQNNSFLNSLPSCVVEKYVNIKSELYHSILSSYLIQKKNHYFIIYGIASSTDLYAFIENCPLQKNVIIICDFDVDFPQDNEHISYLSFQSFYVPPCFEDIKYFFEKNNIFYTDEYGQTLLDISNKNLFLLQSMELLIKTIQDSTKIENLFSKLKNLSLENGNNIINTNKYSMSDLINGKRTGNTLNGHIRRLYGKILSSDEWLLLLLIALYGESGISQKYLDNLLPKASHNIIISLIDKQLINNEEHIYTYEGSLLIPYALIYGKHNLGKDPETLFSDTFSFLKLMLNNICYYNSAPINYALLSVTIKKTYKSIFTFLHKTKDFYQEYFSEIWYYHLRCIRFFWENGDINSINELDENFSMLAKKLTSRPGIHKTWKKIYELYLSFFELVTSPTMNPDNSYNPIIEIIEKNLSLLVEHNFIEDLLPFSEYWKLLVSILEINISLLFRINASVPSFFKSLQDPKYNEYFQKNIQQIKALSLKIFELHAFSKDNLFISEMETIFCNIISIADIYFPPNNQIIFCFSQYSNFYEQPRYKQLAWFKKSCILLSVQSSSKFVEMGSAKILISTYQKLEIIPLELLENYYWALISYTLSRFPSNSKELLEYIYKDFGRYEHIWQHSEIMSHIKKILSFFEI